MRRSPPVVWWQGRQVGAHRIAWELANGVSIPNGRFVLHSCDNPGCVNPDHLRVGTQADNMADRLRRGRNPETLKTHCPAGHAYGGENLIIDQAGRRRCRICRRETNRRANRKRKL